MCWSVERCACAFAGMVSFLWSSCLPGRVSSQLGGGTGFLGDHCHAGGSRVPLGVLSIHSPAAFSVLKFEPSSTNAGTSTLSPLACDEIKFCAIEEVRGVFWLFAWRNFLVEVGGYPICSNARYSAEPSVWPMRDPYYCRDTCVGSGSEPSIVCDWQPAFFSTQYLAPPYRPGCVHFTLVNELPAVGSLRPHGPHEVTWLWGKHQYEGFFVRRESSPVGLWRRGACCGVCEEVSARCGGVGQCLQVLLVDAGRRWWGMWCMVRGCRACRGVGIRLLRVLWPRCYQCSPGYHRAGTA